MELRQRRLLTALLALVALTALGGCATKKQEDSTIPWSRPASWEGQAPGFGGFNPGLGY